jgi:gamma-glutamylcyclotransferase (GGCT)/AIG2-like uncharacterized protein YtfP
MALPEARYHVFVYGTLRPGGYFYRKLVAGRSVEATSAWVQGTLYALDPGYPGLLPGENRVEGSILSFNDPDLLDQLDDLEGYDAEAPEEGEYERGEIDAFTPDGTALGRVFVYWILPQRLEEYQGREVEKWSVDDFGKSE